MKRLYVGFSRMKFLVRFAALAAVGFWSVSCTSTTSIPPMTPSNGSNGSASYTLSYNSPEIEASIAMQGGMTQPAQVILMTTGSLVNNAAITLTGPSSLSLPVTYSYSYSSGTTFIAYYVSSNAWTYQGNQNYTLSVHYSGYSGQATVHSVGNVSFTPGGSSLSIAWQGGGTNNSLIELQTTYPYNQYSITSGVSSPYTVNQSSLGSYTAGSYQITLNAVQMDISAFPGAYVGSYFSASDQETATY
ncbi:MAG TPA: hypothetical protein VJ873_02230 [bacterium]|nr:hypothetical protein [bacterium]